MKDVKNSSFKGTQLFLMLFVVTLILGCIFICYIDNKEQERVRIALEQKKKEEEELLRKENIVNTAKERVNALYTEEKIPKSGINNEEFESSLESVYLVEDEEIKSLLLEEINRISEYRKIEEQINYLLPDGILISSYSDEDIELLEKMVVNIPEEWKNVPNNKIEEINNQKNNINNADKKVRELYSDKNLKKVKTNVTRKKYNDAKKAVDKLLQIDLKKKYNSNLDVVLKYIEDREEKERIAAEEKARKEAEIKAAWIILETPYISQNKNKIYNGCEAASLLMALQYKNQLKNTSLKTFADNMPKSDDNPHQGFVRDIYDFEPRDVPHWIAPDALSMYGKKYYANVFDITGTSVDGLKKELDNGNPVVIYATGGNFDDPVNWIEEVPKNVHVMLLIGYNPKSNQMLINDPWTKTSTGKVYISESRFATIYNKIGKKAVVVR